MYVYSYYRILYGYKKSIIICCDMDKNFKNIMKMKEVKYK